QLRAGNLTPEAEVDAIGSAHHPAQEEIEPLAGAASIGMRQEVLEPPRRRALAGDRPEVRSAQLVDERSESATKVRTLSIMFRKRGAQRAVFAQDRAGAVEQAGDVARVGHAIGEPARLAQQFNGC